MIKVNLLPGSQKRTKRKTGGFAPKPPRMPVFDRMLLFVVAAWVVGIGAILWLFLGVQAERADLEVGVEQAVADSARLAEVIANQRSLRARQDTIAQKLAMIQEIDAGRYIWPHIMDEVSRALPPYTWLEGIDQVSGGPSPQFQINGRSGSLPALTRFMDALEASPFLRNVQLISSERTRVGSERSRVVNNFVLQGSYEPPPLDVVETVPLFDEGQMDSVTAEASDGTGTS
jgi:Tfp pilus assembly protein PilN